MPRRVRTTKGNWFVSQMSLGNLISAGSVLVAITGFYFTTQATLATQAEKLGGIERKIENQDKDTDRQRRTNMDERDQLRKEMIDRAEKTASGIAELNKTTAVLSTQLSTISSDLVKLGNQITTIATTNNSRQ